ncbi:hypothetical protein EV175_006194 [Coemansia sp. RSA 1933]|nr:hypothetical protein EV175_006194 [Coemansia sp. RSA 1933]
MRQAMIAEHNRKSGGTTASSQQLSESPGIDAPPLPGANSIPLVKKPAVNPVMARMQQQKPKLEQQSQKQEQKRRQEKRRQELVQKEQEKLRLELLQQEKLEQEKLEQERQRQQKQQRQEQEKLERQRQELEQQIQVEPDLGTLPVNQAVDDRIDVVSVSSTSSFSLSTSTPKLGPEPKPVAEIQTTAHRPAESEPEPLAMDNVDAQQPMHQPAVIFTTNGSSKSNGKQPITIDSILANVEAPAEAVADSVNPEIEAQTVRAQAINKTALDIDESISLTSNITTLLLTSALVFDGGSQVADQLDSVLAVNLDQAIKLAQSIINGRPASEQNIYP